MNKPECYVPRTISIDLERYDELLRKEAVHDLAKEYFANNKFSSDTEKALFGLFKPEEPEDDF